MCLVGIIEKLRDKKLSYLVKKKNEKIENLICMNLLTCPYLCKTLYYFIYYYITHKHIEYIYKHIITIDLFFKLHNIFLIYKKTYTQIKKKMTKITIDACIKKKNIWQFHKIIIIIIVKIDFDS